MTECEWQLYGCCTEDMLMLLHYINIRKYHRHLIIDRE